MNDSSHLSVRGVEKSNATYVCTSEQAYFSHHAKVFHHSIKLVPNLQHTPISAYHVNVTNHGSGLQEKADAS